MARQFQWPIAKTIALLEQRNFVRFTHKNQWKFLDRVMQRCPEIREAAEEILVEESMEKFDERTIKIFAGRWGNRS